MKNSLVLWLCGLVIIFELHSCKEADVKTATIGMWSIDSITYNGINVRACLDINVLNFENKNECTLPELFATDCGVSAQQINKAGTWAISERAPLLLTIQANNDIFNGQYTVRFIDDSLNKILIMELKSDRTYVSCRKGLSNYDQNRDVIQRLVRLSE